MRSALDAISIFDRFARKYNLRIVSPTDKHTDVAFRLTIKTAKPDEVPNEAGGWQLGTYLSADTTLISV
jgi:hypothetical protein